MSMAIWRSKHGSAGRGGRLGRVGRTGCRCRHSLKLLVVDHARNPSDHRRLADSPTHLS